MNNQEEERGHPAVVFVRRGSEWGAVAAASIVAYAGVETYKLDQAIANRPEAFIAQRVLGDELALRSRRFGVYFPQGKNYEFNKDRLASAAGGIRHGILTNLSWLKDPQTKQSFPNSPWSYYYSTCGSEFTDTAAFLETVEKSSDGPTQVAQTTNAISSLAACEQKLYSSIDLTVPREYNFQNAVIASFVLITCACARLFTSSHYNRKIK